MRRAALFGLAVALLVAGNSAGASAANEWPATVVAGAGAPDGPLLSVRANGVVTNQSRPPTFYGGAYRLPLAQPITGMAITVTGKGTGSPPPTAASSLSATRISTARWLGSI
jgi:hypothetical protein